MQANLVRILLIVITAFVALTAISGGVAMLAGVDRFPAAWLEGTPFPDYTAPALLLAVVVGGSALLASAALLRRRRRAGAVAAAAGLLLAGYIAVEVILLKQAPPGPTRIEIFYFLVGLLLVGLGSWWSRRR